MMNELQHMIRSFKSERMMRAYQAVLACMIAFTLAFTPGLAFATAEGVQGSETASAEELATDILTDDQAAETDDQENILFLKSGLSATEEPSEGVDDSDEPNASAYEIIDGMFCGENQNYDKFKSLSDYEKAFTAHEFMMSLDAVYNPTNTDTSLSSIFNDPAKGKGTSSQVFHSIFAYLLIQMGISDNDVRKVEAGGQAWTLVRLEGQWTHIDVAIDKANAPRGFKYLCFGLTDEQIKFVHKDYSVDKDRQARSLVNNYYYYSRNGVELQTWADIVQERITKESFSGKASYTVEAPPVSENISVYIDSPENLIYSQTAALLTDQTFDGVKASVSYGSSVFTVSIIRDISAAFGSLTIANRTFTGQSLKPILRPNRTDLNLVEDVDYVLSYKRKSDSASLNSVPWQAGEYIVTISGIGNWEGSITKSYTITPAPMTTVEIKSGFSSNVSYTGRPITQEGISLKLDTYENGKVVHSYTLTSNDFYIAGYTNQTGPGAASIILKSKSSNFSGEKRIAFYINGSSQSGSSNGSSNSGSNAPNSSTANNGATNVTTQSAPQAPTVTGTWKKSGGKWWFAYDSKTTKAQDKSYPSNEWVIIKGKRYHFDSRGYMNTKWFSYNGKWYWLGSDGAMKTGWQKSGSKWYYMASDGIMQTGKKNIGNATYYLDAKSGAMKTGWNKEGSVWYHYKSSGAMTKGWLKSSGKWYYMASNGAMQTSKQTISGKTYNFNASGVMITGWSKESGTYYHYGSSGAMTKGWVKSGKKWYYMDTSTGAMKTAWLDLSGKRYFLDPANGDMLTGWNKITTTMSGQATSNFYYFNSSGVLQKNKWVGNYYVGSEGKMLTNTWIGNYHVNANGLWDATRK